VAPRSGFGAFRNNYWTMIGPYFQECFPTAVVMSS
jgi:hypothetical protein